MGALTAGEIVNKATRFAAAVVLGRELSLAEFGLVNVGIAVSGILVMAAGLGLPEIATRDVSVVPERAQALADRVLGGRMAALALLGAALLMVAAVAAPGDLGILALAIAMALGPIWSVDWLLRGLERMGTVATAFAAGGATVLAGSLALTLVDAGAEAALAVFVIGEFVVAGLTLRGARLPRLPRPDLAGLRSALRRSWPLGASALIVYSYYANLDTILLSVLRSAEEAGLYSAAYRLFLAVNVVGTFAAYATLPSISRAVNAGPAADAEAMMRLRRSAVALAGYGLVALGIIEQASADVLEVLFGGRFVPMADVLVVLGLCIPWYSVAFPVGYVLIARDANRRFLAGAAVAGGLNLALNLALIPPFGPEGAAAATTVALIAGATVWLAVHGFATPQTAGLLTLLTLATIGGVLAVVWSSTTTTVALTTTLAGLLAIMRGLKRADGR
jgi:O-antigen/teichoic acid export membrane protein